MADDKSFVAYEIYPDAKVGIEPAQITRVWMDESPGRFAYRCLPMVMANQGGWMLNCAWNVRAYWFGGTDKRDIQIEFDDSQAVGSVVSTFGSGIITFTFPFLFRTPSGINLWVKGPANWIRDGVQALEGIVEADWSTATFTMNWKITRVGQWIEFRAGEPCCMLVPVPRGLASGLDPQRASLSSNVELQMQYNDWQRNRERFLRDLDLRDSATIKAGWQKDYFQGVTPDGQRFQNHETRLNLKNFRQASSVSPQTASEAPSPASE